MVTRNQSGSLRSTVASNSSGTMGASTSWPPMFTTMSFSPMESALRGTPAGTVGGGPTTVSSLPGWFWTSADTALRAVSSGWARTYSQSCPSPAWTPLRRDAWTTPSCCTS
ncbi:hypothetical protein ACFFX0_12250 [Citricoccus parietis]|uniref:Uncharacterized protein n=1 Tax=Citricoccus parietis TaxID=592307 RepID=A0ABV5FZ13_9MICC